ncbi:MAG: hypothetical protein JO159_00940 [Acidobacteria bacterium]|nr:hypothetical protein [Acidobacteriota bacterium]MBV9623564.1 hypothetical protein [Acidobacteriota bacterium]
MDLSYVFLCGLMWCRYGQDEAGCELVRAVSSEDPDVKALAWALLSERDSLKQRSSRPN